MDVSAIRAYILYLKINCGLYITLHPLKYDKLIYPTELISFNIHDNPYCIYVKTCHEAHQYCTSRQCKVHKKSQTGPFDGVCYAGVKEKVYPFYNGEEYAGFVSVSGYKCDNVSGYMFRVAERYELDLEKLKSVYNFLKPEMPSDSQLDTLIKPLISMLELEYLKMDVVSETKPTLFKRIEEHLRKNHNQDIKVEDVCKHFGCSRSYISHNFKANTGFSLKEYLNELRIEDAKSLLEYSDLNVMGVAMAVGFNDSNYFSCTFKERVGISPMAYRLLKRKGK